MLPFLGPEFIEAIIDPFPRPCLEEENARNELREKKIVPRAKRKWSFLARAASLLRRGENATDPARISRKNPNPESANSR
jgi:hypothetical protein